ncbi:MAG TPA: response regulator [Elusimicrobiota bacterium]|nr:response regulator [Elusimicrobiota bacterium]
MAKILVADDEADVRELVKYALERDQHQVLETSSGSETLELLKKETVDLLILDVMLPGMDGYTLQLQLAQDKKTRFIPVIVLTALHPSKSMFAKFSQVREFVPKPFDPMELAGLVQRTLASPVK